MRGGKKLLRGVKKQIVEVVNTENEFFEKAFLIVSDKYLECDNQKLSKKANEYVSAINPFVSTSFSSSKKGVDKRKLLFDLMKYIGFSGIGAIIALFIAK